MQFRYDLIDMREVDGDRLLSSAQVSDNVIGILGRVADTRAAVRRLVERIAELDPGDQFDVNFDAVAPEKEGTYIMTYIVEGGICFPYVAIKVEKP